MNARYLLALEPDRMLAGYRIRAGLEPKAKGYGGWDSVEGIVSRLSDSQVQRMLNTEFGGMNEIGCVFGVRMIRADA